MNVKPFGNLNETALHTAAMYNSNDKVIDLLIKAGANVNAPNIFGSTPIFKAILNGNLCRS